MKEPKVKSPQKSLFRNNRLDEGQEFHGWTHLEIISWMFRPSLEECINKQKHPKN